MNPMGFMKDRFLLSFCRSLELFLVQGDRIRMEKFKGGMSDQFIWFIAEDCFDLWAHVYKACLCISFPGYIPDSL